MRHRITALAAVAAAPAMGVAGCAAGGAAAGAAPTATGTPAQQAALARYVAYAGPPLPYFTWFGHF